MKESCQKGSFIYYFNSSRRNQNQLGVLLTLLIRLTYNISFAQLKIKLASPMIFRHLSLRKIFSLYSKRFLSSSKLGYITSNKTFHHLREQIILKFLKDFKWFLYFFFLSLVLGCDPTTSSFMWLRNPMNSGSSAVGSP